MEVRFEPGTYEVKVRAGRQELLFGGQRLVSPINWSNTRRIFDGVRGMVRAPDDGWTLDVLWTRPVRVRKYAFNPAVSGERLAGVYGTKRQGRVTVEGYLLSTRRAPAEPSEDAGVRHTAGARVTTSLAGLALDAEGAWQWGRDLRASMFSVAPRYTWEGRWAPWLGVGYDFASGDSDPGDGTRETFDPLFPLGHGFLGFIDAVGRQNIQAVVVPVGFWPVPERVSFGADLHWFYLATARDALYNTGRRASRSGDGETAVGQEVDLTVTARLDTRTALTVGLSRFAPGALFESGPTEMVYLLYVQARYDF